MGAANLRWDWGIAALLALAAVLLFAHLESSGVLWQDEAETALLARHTRRFGYPRASDGCRVIELPGFGAGPGQAWLYAPWVPFYLLAGMFALVGESTWAARWPFALFGWLTIWLTGRLARRLTADRTVARLAAALLTVSVPFLLHMRQCRYYALTAFLLVAVCLTYLRVLTRASGTRIGLLGCLLVLLFHTNFGTFLPAFGALLLHWSWRGQHPRLAPAAHGRWWGMSATVAALTAPWALFAYRPFFVGHPSLARAAKHLEYYVRITNMHLVPIAFIGAATLLWWVLAKRSHGATSRAILSEAVRPSRGRVEGRRPRRALSEGARVLGLVALGQVVFLLLVPDQRHMRYLIPTLPLLILGQAWWLARGLRARPRLGLAIAALMLTTNALQSVHWRVPLTDFVYELTHHYRGPMDGVVAYLNAHARPDETVKIPYDDRTLMFYTPLLIEPPSSFDQPSEPDWIVLRRDWLPEGFRERASFREIERRYERIELDAPDCLWQNREDPGSHHFRTVADAPPVVLYRKRQIRHG